MLLDPKDHPSRRNWHPSSAENFTNRTKDKLEERANVERKINTRMVTQVDINIEKQIFNQKNRYLIRKIDLQTEDRPKNR